MELRRSHRCRIKGGRAQYASAHVGVPALTGHRTVALLGLRLAQEVLARAATAVERATEELWTEVEVRRVLGVEAYRSRRALATGSCHQVPLRPSLLQARSKMGWVTEVPCPQPGLRQRTGEAKRLETLRRRRRRRIQRQRRR